MAQQSQAVKTINCYRMRQREIDSTDAHQLVQRLFPAEVKIDRRKPQVMGTVGVYEPQLVVLSMC